MTWLAPPVAVALALRLPGWKVTAWITLGVAGATQIVFPWLYSEIIQQGPRDHARARRAQRRARRPARAHGRRAGPGAARRPVARGARRVARVRLTAASELAGHLGRDEREVVQVVQVQDLQVDAADAELAVRADPVDDRRRRPREAGRAHLLRRRGRSPRPDGPPPRRRDPRTARWRRRTSGCRGSRPAASHAARRTFTRASTSCGAGKFRLNSAAYLRGQRRRLRRRRCRR